MKNMEEIKAAYIERYPHLANIKYGNVDKAFARAALRLEAPRTVTASEVWKLAQIS